MRRTHACIHFASTWVVVDVSSMHNTFARGLLQVRAHSHRLMQFIFTHVRTYSYSVATRFVCMSELT